MLPAPALAKALRRVLFLSKKDSRSHFSRKLIAKIAHQDVLKNYSVSAEKIFGNARQSVPGIQAERVGFRTERLLQDEQIIRGQVAKAGCESKNVVNIR